MALFEMSDMQIKPSKSMSHYTKTAKQGLFGELQHKASKEKEELV